MVVNLFKFHLWKVWGHTMRRFDCTTNRNERRNLKKFDDAKPNLLNCGKPPIIQDFKNLFFDRKLGRKPSRIVGGSVAKPYSWPWQIAWCEMVNGVCSFQCGGTVIHNNWVLTAGHCVYGSGRLNRPDKFRVKVGLFVASSINEPGEVIHLVKNIHLHPYYTDDWSPDYDIALIELETPIAYTQYVQPICLPNYDYTYVQPENTVWATGWGLTTENGYASNQLRQVSIPVHNQQTCKNAYGSRFKQWIMICAGSDGKDTCQGDSGGPLQQINHNGRWFQYGITSFGIGCARSDSPGVYARVSYFCRHIENTTRGEVKCYNPNHK